MSPAAAPASGLVHDALFYDDDEALLATAVPFVREGVERGEVVLVNTGSHPVTALLKAMFAEQESVLFPNAAVYARPVSAIDQYKRALDTGLADDVPAFRAIGHIDFGDGLPWQEWVRYEAAVNLVFADYPFETMCPYDSRTLAPEIITAMKQAHPWLLQDGRRLRNPEYVDPVELATKPEYAEPVHPLQATPPELELDEITDVRTLRMDLYPVTIFTELPRHKVDDFVKAVSAIASNAQIHGEEPVCVRLWTTPNELLATVTDQGHGVDDPFKGYARSIGNARTHSVSTHEGLGMWAARQLCDILDYERTDDGFTVRLVAYTGNDAWADHT
ncbi:MAG TPA: anti-sigma factor RsbA family regulatory protein [Nocardioidaceae bacterium]|nr:anti-sigma factor RsbA family regulatory protein [Nocardioidaceae bacterium]